MSSKNKNKWTNEQFVSIQIRIRMSNEHTYIFRPWIIFRSCFRFMLPLRRNLGDWSIWEVWKCETLNGITYWINGKKFESFFKIENKLLFKLEIKWTATKEKYFRRSPKTKILSTKIPLKQFQIYYRLLRNNRKTFIQSAIKINSNAWIENGTANRRLCQFSWMINLRRCRSFLSSSSFFTFFISFNFRFDLPQ